MLVAARDSRVKRFVENVTQANVRPIHSTLENQW
jgi:hypothetical protein